MKKIFFSEIYSHRIVAGISANRLSAESGVDKKTIAKLESGESVKDVTVGRVLIGFNRIVQKKDLPLIDVRGVLLNAEEDSSASVA